MLVYPLVLNASNSVTESQSEIKKQISSIVYNTIMYFDSLHCTACTARLYLCMRSHKGTSTYMNHKEVIIIMHNNLFTYY